MATTKKHVDDESKVERAAKRLTKRKQVQIDAEPTEAQRGHPEYVIGGEDYKGKGQICGVVVCEQYTVGGYVIAGEEYVDTGPQQKGFTVMFLNDGEKCMIDGGSVRFIR